MALLSPINHAQVVVLTGKPPIGRGGRKNPMGSIGFGGIIPGIPPGIPIPGMPEIPMLAGSINSGPRMPPADGSMGGAKWREGQGS